mgnify:CR=1 FL=1
MRLELSATRPEPIKDILNTLERRLRKMGIEELKYFNCYILKGDSTHIEFKIGKKDREPYDFSKDTTDESNIICNNF